MKVNNTKDDKEVILTQASLSLPFGVEAILFDLDDTLYDRDQAYLEWAFTFVQTSFPGMEDTQMRQTIDLLVELDEHEDTPRDVLFSQFREQYPALQVPVTTLVEEYYREFPRYIKLQSEVRQLLHMLKAASIPFGIITNGSSRQLRKLELLTLNQLTSCVFISQLFGCEKPDPAIFQAAAAALHVPPRKILFVGDNPLNDIWGAHCVGMRTAWLRRGRPWPPTLSLHVADMTIHSLQEIEKYEDIA